MGRFKLSVDHYKVDSTIWRAQINIEGERLCKYDSETIDMLMSRFSRTETIEMMRYLQGHINEDKFIFDTGLRSQISKLTNYPKWKLANFAAYITSSVLNIRTLIDFIKMFDGSPETEWNLKLYIRMLLSLMGKKDYGFSSYVDKFVRSCPGLNDSRHHVVDKRLISCFDGYKYNAMWSYAIADFIKKYSKFVGIQDTSSDPFLYEDPTAVGYRIAEYYVDHVTKFNVMYKWIVDEFGNSESIQHVALMKFFERINNYIQMRYNEHAIKMKKDYNDELAARINKQLSENNLVVSNTNLTIRHADLQIIVLMMIFIVLYGIYMKL